MNMESELLLFPFIKFNFIISQYFVSIHEIELDKQIERTAHTFHHPVKHIGPIYQLHVLWYWLIDDEHN